MEQVKTIGDNVHLTFSSTATAAVAQPMIILDANMQGRTLKTWERLIIDDIQGNSSVGQIDIIAGSTSNVSTLIGSFNPSEGLVVDTKEGVSLPINTLPWVLPVGTGSTATIRVAGNGRIVEGTTQGVRPSWREAMVRGDSMAKIPGFMGSRALTTELRKLGAQVITTLDDGTQLTREEVLADLIWKQALGWTETWWETDLNGSRVKREMKHKPVSWAQQYLFERMEGKAAQAITEEGGGIKAAEKVRELAKQRINSLARVTAGPPPLPKAKPNEP